MKNDELLPCPFCGELPEVNKLAFKVETIKCSNSGCALHYIRNMCVSEWNTRQTPSDTTTQYNPADCGDKVSGLSMDVTKQIENVSNDKSTNTDDTHTIVQTYIDPLVTTHNAEIKRMKKEREEALAALKWIRMNSQPILNGRYNTAIKNFNKLRQYIKEK